MILSHRALTSFNMSSYRAIGTHFEPKFIFLEPEISDPGLQILILSPKILDPGSKILILVHNPDPGFKNLISWLHVCASFFASLPTSASLMC